MKICAITMVYKDYWALSQWYAHYSKLIGSKNLFVVAHGEDKRILRICPQASVITIPRDDMSDFDAKRARMLNNIQRGLGEIYDWVIRTDADELICLDPTKFASFDDFFQSRTSDAVFALGLDIVQRDDDADLARGQNVFEGRKQAVFSGHYSKAWAVRSGVQLHLHGVKLKPRRLAKFKYDLPQGVYLAHLKFANLPALANANKNRRKAARRKEQGVPGTAWRMADTMSDQMFEQTATYDHLNWFDASTAAYETQISEHKRDTRSGLLRSKFNQFRFKTTLPDWFGKNN